MDDVETESLEPAGLGTFRVKDRPESRVRIRVENNNTIAEEEKSGTCMIFRSLELFSTSNAAPRPDGSKRSGCDSGAYQKQG